MSNNKSTSETNLPETEKLERHQSNPTSTSSTSNPIDLSIKLPSQSIKSDIDESSQQNNFDNKNKSKFYPPKPKLSKAERRALQEKQRSEKAARKKPLMKTTSVRLQHDDPKKVQKLQKKQIIPRQRMPQTKQVALFSHLPQYEKANSLSLQIGFATEILHPEIVRFGLKLVNRTITGPNCCSVAMLTAFKQFYRDYKRPSNKSMRLDLESKINRLIQFISDCRPISVSMGNVTKQLKADIARIDPDLPDEQAKNELIEDIDIFINTRILRPDSAIIKEALSQIKDNDVLLTYSQSYTVEKLIKEAWKSRKNLQIIVVGGRPGRQAIDMLERLARCRIKCTYILINAVPLYMNKVTKVFLGAHGIFSNGTVISTIGSAMVGSIAHVHNVPVIVCCHSYKFSDRVQIDSIVSNELGDPDDLITIEHRPSLRYLSNWRSIDNLKLLNLELDLMPAEFVSQIITEFGAIPATSVPVIIREYRSFA